MQTSFEWTIQIAGTLLFGSSFIYFLSRYRNNLKKRESGKIAITDPIFAINLFFTLASLAILFNIWNVPLRDFFTGILLLCALVSWLAWKISQQTRVE